MNLKVVLTSCKIRLVFYSLKCVSSFWKIICNSSKFRSMLPKICIYIYIYIYITYQKILSKAKKDRSIRVNLQRVHEVLRNRETLKERTNLLFSFIVSCPKLIVENMNPSNILFNIKINVGFVCFSL